MARRLTKPQLERARETLFSAADKITSQLSTSGEMGPEHVVGLAEKLLVLLKAHDRLQGAGDYALGALK